MVKKDGKLYYNWTDYTEDMAEIIRDIRKIENPYIVGVHRGSLGMASHISNVLDIKMGIITHQTRDGDSKEPKWLLKEYTDDCTVIIIDDIYDSGKTFVEISKIVPTNTRYISIFDNIKATKVSGAEDLKISTKRTSYGDWIVFPIEV